MKLLDYRASYVQLWKILLEQFFKVAVPIYIPTQFIRILANHWYFLSFKKKGHSGGYIVVMLCDLIISSQHLQVIPTL